MPDNFCPFCAEVTSMTITTVRRREQTVRGFRTTETKSYHCEKCHTFVRSEETEIDPSEEQ